MKKQITKDFLNLYSQWEQYLKSRYGKKDMYSLSKNFLSDEKDRCKKEGISENHLLGLVNIRNAYAHSSELLEITKYANVLLRRLINIFVKKALDIATPKNKIYSANLNTKVFKVMRQMAEHLYTHVPIISGNKFYGVFSENTILKIMISKTEIKNLRIKDVLKIIKKTEEESTDAYRFLPIESSFYDVYQLFQEYIDHGKRLGVVFLTENGKESGNICGLITAWDLHKGFTKK